jgi:hypothetical protein
MNAIMTPPLYTRLSDHVRTGSQPEVLAEIFADDVNLALWNRRLADQTSTYARQLQGVISLSLQTTGNGTDLKRFLEKQLPSGSGRESFIADIDMLADMLDCLFEPDALGLRLAVLDKPMCPRFHVDRVVCRLVTTYAGPGTEWLSNSAVNRHFLGPAHHEKHETCSDICSDPSGHHQARIGTVCLLKGERWEGNEGNGIVHRSAAPLPGQPRLFLSMDLL